MPGDGALRRGNPAWQWGKGLISCARHMRSRWIALSLVLGLWACACLGAADAPLTWSVRALNESEFEYDMATGRAVATNGVAISYGTATLVADKVDLDQQSGEAQAEGHVRLTREQQVWAGDRIRFNFKTGE